MSFDSTANFIYLENPAIAVGTGPIGVDVSSVKEVTTLVQTNTSPVVNMPGEPMSYNGVETIFDFRVPSNSRICFDKSYLRFTGYASNMAIGAASPCLDGTSIPWNTVAALLSAAEVQLNQSANTTEKINQNLGDGSMVKFLTRFSREVIEGMDDCFFTPCFEERRDRNDGIAAVPPLPVQYGLSTVSRTRRINQLIYATGGVQRVHSKNVYLGDLFDSLRLPAAFFLQNLQLKIQPKLASEILIRDTGLLGAVAAANQKYFITNITLYLTMVQLTENQLVRERQKILDNVSILRLAFWSFDATQKTHSQSASYRDSNVRSLQAAVLLFPSTGAADGLGANPYQYCYGSGAGGHSGLTSYVMKYDEIYSPSLPLAISTTQFSTNTHLFAQYRLVCKRMMDREINPALRMVDFAPDQPTLDDPSTYVLFCSQFFPLTAHSHKLIGGADHEIITTGGSDGAAVIVRMRISYMEIRGDTSVYVLN